MVSTKFISFVIFVLLIPVAVLLTLNKLLKSNGFCVKKQCCGFLKIGSPYVALTVLELTMETRLASTSQSSICLCLPRAENKSVCHGA